MIKTAQAIKATIGSKMSAAGLAYLGHLAKCAPVDGIFIDIGTYKGASAMMMHKADPSRIIVTLDNYTEGTDAKTGKGKPPTPQQVANNLDSHNIWIVKSESSCIPNWLYPSSLGLVFIDADHHGDAVRRDILAWRDHVTPGGIMAFDDYGSTRWPDVKPVVDELMHGWTKLGCKGKVAAFRRGE